MAGPVPEISVFPTGISVINRLDYQPLFGKMSPHSSPRRRRRENNKIVEKRKRKKIEEGYKIEKGEG